MSSSLVRRIVGPASGASFSFARSADNDKYIRILILELLEVSKSARQQFSRQERFIAIEAMALDRLGQSAEAMESRVRVVGYLVMHTRQLDMGMGDDAAVRYYRSKIDSDLQQILSAS